MAVRFFSPYSTIASTITTAMALSFIPSLYLVFLGQALRLPSTAWLRNTWGVAIVLLAPFALFEVAGGTFAGSAYVGPATANQAYLQTGKFLYWRATPLFGIVVALQARRSQPKGSIGRRGAVAFAFAFGARDLGFVIAILDELGGTLGVSGNLPQGATATAYLAFMGFEVLSVGLLGYGVLSMQMLDIDARLRMTVNVSAVMSAFTVVFGAVGAVAGEFLLHRFGYAVGGLAAAAMLIAIGPLRRTGSRVAAWLVPAGR